MRWNSRVCRIGLTLILAGVAPCFVAITITVLLFAQGSGPETQVQNPSNQQPDTAPTDTTAQNSQPVRPPRPVLILIDPAHGGSESGAILNPSVLEKDVNLAFARNLREQLNSRGVPAQLLRDSNVLLTTDQRAAIANSSRPVLYLAIHSTSMGTGVRIYSAMLPDGADDRGPFLYWQTAQSTSLSRSRWAQQQLAATIQRAGFPVRAIPTALRPLNNLKVPALAVEIASTTGSITQLSSNDYQQMVSALLASSLAPIRATLESQQ